DKPMIYYPLSVLMLAGIKDILIISTPHDTPRFKELLGSGKNLGLNLSYTVQDEPKGIAEALIIGEDFINGDSVALILGDNIFYGHNLTEILKEAMHLKKGAFVFGCYVKDPARYGVIEFNRNCRVTSIKEKPRKPKSNWAVCGLYFYDKNAARFALALKPSARGEIEITDLNNVYLKRKQLKVKLLGRGYAWLDTGTYDSLIDASLFIKTIEERQSLKIGGVEEVAYRMGYINAKQLEELSKGINTSYGQYLKRILEE
ncbi:MAG: glucose-1-phosphate thymidylyltransferase RfbA, partial [Candidatus Omnitrophica bacterium]|nr:glucose-1-phosphate thymidylyltransferase RfbA [Candidatus Omnitrophota bacterium]